MVSLSHLIALRPEWGMLYSRRRYAWKKLFRWHKGFRMLGYSGRLRKDCRNFVFKTNAADVVVRCQSWKQYFDSVLYSGTMSAAIEGYRRTPALDFRWLLRTRCGLFAYEEFIKRLTCRYWRRASKGLHDVNFAKGAEPLKGYGCAGRQRKMGRGFRSTRRHNGRRYFGCWYFVNFDKGEDTMNGPSRITSRRRSCQLTHAHRPFRY